MQRLPIEPISQASANQRAGRCGRVAAGTCIRLYSEEDFAARPEFTEPEILRTNLASVILQMTAIGLGDVAAFPFVEPPDAAAIRDGYLLLEELAAIGPAGHDGVRPLTSIGRRLARLPVDPRLGRMVLEADRHGCVREVLVIAAALSIQDPRERPVDERAEADASHRRFDVDGSDLLVDRRLVGLPARRTARPIVEPVPQVVPRRVPQLPARARVAGLVQPASPCRRRPRHSRRFGCRPSRPRPSVGARRPAVAPRVPRSRRPRVPRRTWCRVRDRPGVGAGQTPAALGDGRRVGRDESSVGAPGGGDPAGVGRADRRPSRQADVWRAALGPPRRSGHRHRDRDPLRSADRRRPDDRLRPGRQDDGTGPVHPQRPRLRRVGRAPSLSRTQP